MEGTLSRGADLGPVIDTSGWVFAVEDPDFPVSPAQQFKVVFGVSAVPDGPEVMNRFLDRVARFANMHVEAGVPRENLDLVVMLYGGASGVGLADAAYRERYEVDNPNAGLLRALADTGIEIYVCAQSARAQGMTRDQFAGPVGWAYSAMTVFAALDHQGYYVDSQ
jgi:intracellular sulfur oxidation DsrE/DsrF family protein